MKYLNFTAEEILAEAEAQGPATVEEVHSYVQRYWVHSIKDLKESYVMAQRCRLAGILGLLSELQKSYRIESEEKLQRGRTSWLATEEASLVRLELEKKTNDSSVIDELMQVAAASGALMHSNGLKVDPKPFAESHWNGRNFFDLETSLSFNSLTSQMDQDDTSS